MTNRLWSLSIVCLLVSSCGVPLAKPLQDQSSTRHSNPDTTYSSTQVSRGLVESQLDKETTRLNADLSMSPTSFPLSSTTPATTFAPRSPSPNERSTSNVKSKSSPKKATSQPESSKRPSLPVQKNQGQARILQKKLTLSQLVVKYPDTFKLRGSSQEKKVALTFDDGPDTRFTPKVLDALKANGVKATFFVLGSMAYTHPDIIKRIVNEGHVIGNHSYSHENLPKLSADKFQNQIVSTESILQGMIGYAPKLIRPPYGAINEEQVRWIADHHYLIVNWNVDSLDWKSLKAEQVLHNIMQQTKPGSIILQHSGGADSQDLSGTVQAISPLISKLKAAGYTFVTVPELLHVTKGK
ncbi:polysaccharide deacetylase family protein [Paenibacillus roseipurpureus]|uniref:Polysaccharide deacetylase family protein n=1 Tax=Paenibacillus roseopurpureus TaxID=2918901 RepID=A0AA96RPF3_9BACL|nr:polysaccharide deacetylase family protein [Paenibacillus sp. MBLB1832]WNR46597.1 polysaccharide deacetylase family protein [Paenibacillus sp. MBLB1832]